MKVINKKLCVISLLVILEISSIFLMYKSNSNKEIKLDNVENKEVVNNNMLAIMIEQSNGTYSQYTTNNNWPSDNTYVLNTLKSGCVDNEGNEIKKGMVFDKNNRKIIIKTNKTSNCYAYFTKSAQYKVEHAESVWNSDLEGDGYRYYGAGSTTNADVGPANYVCFGTQSKSECVADTDKYMYRIIGMFQEENGNGTINTSSDYHLKLIKKEALNIKTTWNDDKMVEIKWSQSDLYKGLNGNYFLNNPEYYYLQKEFWYSKISNWKWIAANSNYNIGGINYFSQKAMNVYLDEMNRTGKPSASKSTYDTPTAKIGLMYISDYMLSLGSDAKNYLGTSYTTLKTGWLFISNNDNAKLSTTHQSSLNTTEWTISQNDGIFEGEDSDGYTAWAIINLGFVTPFLVSSNSYVSRPAFYLNSDVVICSGSGTSTDPYILG